MTRQRGMTLIELSVVMVIVAILFFSVRPAVTGILREAQERTALRQLVGLLTYARTEAVGSGRLVRVLCDPRHAAFWAEAQVDPRGDRSSFELLRVLGRSRVRMPETFAIAQLMVSGRDASLQGGEIYFYPDGRNDGLVLTLVGEAGREVMVEVLSATGRVLVSA